MVGGAGSIREGVTLAGRYRIDRRIGAGAMGEVWAGVADNGDAVAVKVLLPESAKDATLVARFRREASLLARLESPRVARVVDFIDDAARPGEGLAIVMKYVAGKSLGARLAEGPISVEEAAEIGAEVARGLTDLHGAGIVHRDLKPDNIILAREGDRTRAVVVDLGVSRLAAPPSQVSLDDPAGLTFADTAIGTLPYMAPEQLVSSTSAGAPADVYALGAVLYRAVVGRPVFDVADDGEIARAKLLDEAPPIDVRRADEIATGLASIVARALRRMTGERPTAAEIARDLEALGEIARARALELEPATEIASSLPATLAHPTDRMSAPPTMSASLVTSGITTSPLARTDPSPGAAPPSVEARAVEPRSIEPGEEPLERSISLGSRPTVHSPILVTPPYESPKVALVLDPASNRPSVAIAVEDTASSGESPIASQIIPAASLLPHAPTALHGRMVTLHVALAMAFVALTVGSGVGFAVGALIYGAHSAH